MITETSIGENLNWSTVMLNTNMVHPSFNNWNTTEVIQNITNENNITSGGTLKPEAAPLEAVVGITILFCIIGLVGIIGNSLVIIVVLVDRKMRQSVTNIFIMNLAISDLIIMVFGIPEILQFILNRGWILGLALCKFNRFVLVASLYTSVLSLMSVCVERFVAIVYPIKAQILCNRRKNTIIVSVIWSFAILCAMPIAIYNKVVPIMPTELGIHLCKPAFPHVNRDGLIFNLFEFIVFYLLPVCIQVVLYSFIGRRLYTSTDELTTKFQMRKENSCKSDRAAETIKARKDVVKMLAASVMVYIFCYAPPQVLIFYRAFASTPLKQTWSFIAFVNVIGYINSAANPILYAIFSQNFRRNFKKCLCCLCIKTRENDYRRARFDSFDARGLSRKVSSSCATRTTISKL